ncbi:MAG: DUF1997 domain-containing protein [Chloroflexota bacterium]
MIEIVGLAHRSFIFPADQQNTFTYYNDLQQAFNHLPHISLLQCFSDTQYRMRYSTVEMGIYRVRIICDLQVESDPTAWAIRIRPLAAARPMRSEWNLHSLSGYGYFNSESLFFEQGEQTRVDYHLKLNARLPVPLGLRYMPSTVIQRIANSIVNARMTEIADQFIARSVKAYEARTIR